VALIAALFATMFLSCLGVSLVLLGSAGTALVAHDRQAAAAARAADAGIRLAISELRERPDWSGAVAAGTPADTSEVPGRFLDTTFFPRAPWDGSLLDLHALTQQLQTASDAAAPAGAAGPVWRVFEYGPISRLIPSDPGRYPAYVVVWAADGSGVVLLRSTALARGAVRASIEGAVGRQGGSGGLVRLTLRSVP